MTFFGHISVARRVFGPWGGGGFRAWLGSYCVWHSFYGLGTSISRARHPRGDAGAGTIF